LRNIHTLLKLNKIFFSKNRSNIKSITDHLRQNLELAQEELKIKEPLATEGIISQVELLAVKRNVVTLSGQLEDAKSNYLKEASSQMTQAKEDLESLEEAIRGYEDRVLRATIRSPVHGTVKNILVNTVGGVVRPGENIMEIVPLDDTLIIKTKISPKDIGFIHPGQKATVKFTAYDYAIYGGLDGVVETISADTITDPRGESKGESSYYEVRIRTFKNYLGHEWAPMPIIPGMVADVSIVTGERSILGYIIKPIIRGQSVFSER
jgi:adhesin transport system membrane fusion protein